MALMNDIQIWTSWTYQIRHQDSIHFGPSAKSLLFNNKICTYLTPNNKNATHNNEVWGIIRVNLGGGLNKKSSSWYNIASIAFRHTKKAIDIDNELGFIFKESTNWFNS